MAGTGIIGALRVNLGLDSAAFTSGANAATRSAEQLQRGLSRMGGAAAPFRRVTDQMDRATAAIRRTNSEYARAQAGGRGFGATVGQLGFQVQDFATQVAGGTSALTAFGQQAPQALGIFGPKGAIIGAVVAVGAAILGVSAKTNDMRFNFQKFAADIGPIMEPAKAVFFAVGAAIKWLGNAAIDGANLIINELMYLSAAIGALPQAFRNAFDQIEMRFRAFGLSLQAGAYEAQSVIQKLRDAVSPNGPEGGFLGLPEESGATAAENYAFIASNLKAQADALRQNAENAQGFGDTIANAVANVKAVDLRDYFESAGEAAEEAGAKVSEKLKPAITEVQRLSESIGQSMEGAFMSMVDGTSSVKDAFKSMARDIIAELYRVLVVQRLVASISGSSAFTGFLGAIGANANGTPYWRGGLTRVNERGGEIMNLPRGTQIIPADVSKRMADNAGGGTVVVQQTINVSTGVQQTVRSEIRALMPQIAESAKAAVVDAKRRGGSYGGAFA